MAFGRVCLAQPLEPIIWHVYTSLQGSGMQSSWLGVSSTAGAEGEQSGLSLPDALCSTRRHAVSHMCMHCINVQTNKACAQMTPSCIKVQLLQCSSGCSKWTTQKSTYIVIVTG